MQNAVPPWKLPVARKWSAAPLVKTDEWDENEHEWDENEHEWDENEP
jgi:hypothetical protein